MTSLKVGDFKTPFLHHAHTLGSLLCDNTNEYSSFICLEAQQILANRGSVMSLEFETNIAHKT